MLVWVGVDEGCLSLCVYSRRECVRGREGRSGGGGRVREIRWGRESEGDQVGEGEEGDQVGEGE